MTDVHDLADESLKAAYANDWKSAVRLNKQIIDLEPENLDAQCRLAKAYMELGRVKHAVITYKKVLKLDQYNTIAQKNLKRLENYSTGFQAGNGISNSFNFIEEPGVTKTVQLVNIGEPKMLAGVDSGDEVSLSLRKRFVCVNTMGSEHYLGKMPEDLSLRLLSLMKEGNKYRAWVKSVTDKSVSLFVKEVYRCPKCNNITSFPDSKSSPYLAFTDPERIYEDRPDARSTEERE